MRAKVKASANIFILVVDFNITIDYKALAAAVSTNFHFNSYQCLLFSRMKSTKMEFEGLSGTKSLPQIYNLGSLYFVVLLGSKYHSHNDINLLCSRGNTHGGIYIPFEVP